MSRSSFFSAQERLHDTVSEFTGNISNLHPERFLSQIEAYFDNVPLCNAQQLISIQRRMSGDAKLWYKSLIPVPCDYVKFKILFRQSFWSAATQRKTRNDVFRPFQNTWRDGLAIHAMKWIACAKYITPSIELEDLVSTIIHLSMALRGRGPRNTNELLAILNEFEESASFCEDRNSSFPRQPYGDTSTGNQNNNRNNFQNHRNNFRNNNRFQHPPPNNDGGQQRVDQIDGSGNNQESHH